MARNRRSTDAPSPTPRKAAADPPRADVVERLLVPGDPDEVWDAVVRSGSDSWLGPEVELPLEAGAPGWVLDDAGIVRRLVVDDVAPAERLRWEWWPDPDGARSRVEVTLAPVGDQTLVTVIEAPSAPPGAWPAVVAATPSRATGRRPTATSLLAAPLPYPLGAGGTDDRGAGARVLPWAGAWFLPDPAPPMAWAAALRRLVHLPARLAVAR